MLRLLLVYIDLFRPYCHNDRLLGLREYSSYMYADINCLYIGIFGHDDRFLSTREYIIEISVDIILVKIRWSTPQVSVF